ncbi:MAG TPA: hypothetical protein VLL77_10605 [Anaerolineales bacterium]|nr:hypothetical protein [Anaerolineales bacterium]
MSGATRDESPIPLQRYLRLTLLVWLASLGLDFFIHGGILASVYIESTPFLLPGAEAFRRIPLGYLALFLTSALLTWILAQTSARGWRKGLALGLALGTVMGLSSSLGLYSISTVSPGILAAAFAAQILEGGIAGAIVGQGLQARSLGRLTLIVVLAVVVLIAATIILQSTGAVPLQRAG